MTIETIDMTAVPDARDQKMHDLEQRLSQRNQLLWVAVCGVLGMFGVMLATLMIPACTTG